MIKLYKKKGSYKLTDNIHDKGYKKIFSKKKNFNENDLTLIDNIVVIDKNENKEKVIEVLKK